jgi:hypothetical protein
MCAQTASKFPLRWWIINSTLSRRDQLDEPSGRHRPRAIMMKSLEDKTRISAMMRDMFRRSRPDGG